MTDKPTPTDAEREALLLAKLPASKHYIRPVIEKMVAAMQAAIDKWGTPAPVGVEPTEEPSLCNDPRLCCRSHPHDKQDLHCQLREVAAWLRWHVAVGKTPSAESMNTHAEQVDAVALALRAAPVAVDAASKQGAIQ